VAPPHADTTNGYQFGGLSLLSLQQCRSNESNAIPIVHSPHPLIVESRQMKMQDHERGLALVAEERYPEALAAFEAASQAGCVAATFELAQAYDWLYYGTYWAHEQRYPRFYSIQQLKKAARQGLGFVPARAYLLTHDFSSLCSNHYDNEFGRGAFERDFDRDKYMRLRLICYHQDGSLNYHGDPTETRLQLFQECASSNLPVPGDLAHEVMTHSYPWDADAPALLKRMAPRGMPWAQFYMGIHVEPNREEYWHARAARNGYFHQAWYLKRNDVLMFERSLHLDWFAPSYRRHLRSERGLVTIAYMRKRFYDERRTKPLTPTEVYHFGRAAHRLLVEEDQVAGQEPIRPNFAFWHKLGQDYRDCITNCRRTVAAFLVATVANGMPRDVARHIARHHIWEQRAKTASHCSYPLGVRNAKKKRKKKKI